MISEVQRARSKQLRLRSITLKCKHPTDVPKSGASLPWEPIQLMEREAFAWGKTAQLPSESPQMTLTPLAVEGALRDDVSNLGTPLDACTWSHWPQFLPQDKFSGIFSQGWRGVENLENAVDHLQSPGILKASYISMPSLPNRSCSSHASSSSPADIASNPQKSSCADSMDTVYKHLALALWVWTALSSQYPPP